MVVFCFGLSPCHLAHGILVMFFFLHRSEFVRLVGQCLYALVDPITVSVAPSSQPIVAMHRANLNILGRFQFPEHFSDVLRVLVLGAMERQLPPGCWADLIDCLHGQVRLSSLS